MTGVHFNLTFSSLPLLAKFSLIHLLAKPKFPSLNVLFLLYPQPQQNEIEVSRKYGIALLFQSFV